MIMLITSTGRMSNGERREGCRRIDLGVIYPDFSHDAVAVGEILHVAHCREKSTRLTGGAAREGLVGHKRDQFVFRTGPSSTEIQNEVVYRVRVRR